MRGVSVIIPNWNGRRLLPSLLQDLRSQTAPPAEIVVVDNGSTDGSADLAESYGVRVIRLATNGGFAVAVNRGVAAARSPLVAIVNNDVHPDRRWLEALLQSLEEKPADFATGKLVSDANPDIIDGTFDAICRGGTAWRCGHGQTDGPPWNTPRQICFAPFTAILWVRARFLALGGLDERFHSYLEDVDFGLRCASNGYTGLYVPGAVARHLGSATWGTWNARTVRQIARNQVLLLAIHYPTPSLVQFGWKIAIAQLLWGLVALRHGAGFAWTIGKIEGLRFWGACRRKGNPRIEFILGSSEEMIRQLQHGTRADWYWRIYFALT